MSPYLRQSLLLSNRCLTLLSVCPSCMRYRSLRLRFWLLLVANGIACSLIRRAKNRNFQWLSTQCFLFSSHFLQLINYHWKVCFKFKMDHCEVEIILPPSKLWAFQGSLTQQSLPNNIVPHTGSHLQEMVETFSWLIPLTATLSSIRAVCKRCVVMEYREIGKCFGGGCFPSGAKSIQKKWMLRSYEGKTGIGENTNWWDSNVRFIQSLLLHFVRHNNQE